MLFRILVTDDPQTGGWKVQALDPSGQELPFSPRSMSAQQTLSGKFPLPPPGQPIPAGINEAELRSAYENLMKQAAGSGGVERFGRYLFNCLLGHELWQSIDQMAGVQPIELALTWKADDAALNRLPWEIMHSGQPEGWEGFLAGNPGVAITRRVANAQADLPGGTLPSPPKVLFVVASTLKDPVIRPGAEFLGLLQTLKEGNLSLNHRLLLNASLGQLRQAVGTYRPSIVHIIGHGEMSGSKGQLRFRKSDKITETEGVDVRALLDALTDDGQHPPPQVVVLNACSTAGAAEEVEAGRPMAAELVAQGVPVVVGMSGQVADQACRLFTKGFYKTLLQGGNIAQSAARGRRAAIAHGSYAPSDVLDWGLPALFLSQSAGEPAINVLRADDEIERQQAAERFLIDEKYPVFCGRWDIYNDYHQLVNTNNYHQLIIGSDFSDRIDTSTQPVKIGRTRLLKELAAQAMRDGHIPVLILKETQEGIKHERWPEDYRQFISEFLVPAAWKTVEILKTRTTVHRDLSWTWNWLTRLLAVGEQEALPPDFQDEFEQFKGEVWSRSIARACRLDLLALRAEVIQQRQTYLAANPQLAVEDSSQPLLIILVDDVHQMQYYNKLRLLLDSPGLGDSQRETRVVLTYNTRPVGEQSSAVDAINDWTNTTMVLSHPLGKFHEALQLGSLQALNTEQREALEKATLAYKHFLLNWEYPRGHRKPLAVVSSRGEADNPGQIVIENLAAQVQGYPSNLSRSEVSVMISVYSQGMGNRPFLRVADDEDAISLLDNQLRKRGDPV